MRIKDGRWGRTVRAEVNRAARDAAANVVVNAHGQVVTVDEGDYRKLKVSSNLNDKRVACAPS